MKDNRFRFFKKCVCVYERQGEREYIEGGSGERILRGFVVLCFRIGELFEYGKTQ